VRDATNKFFDFLETALTTLAEKLPDLFIAVLQAIGTAVEVLLERIGRKLGEFGEGIVEGVTFGLYKAEQETAGLVATEGTGRKSSLGAAGITPQYLAITEASKTIGMQALKAGMGQSVEEKQLSEAEKQTNILQDIARNIANPQGNNTGIGGIVEGISRAVQGHGRYAGEYGGDAGGDF
jgi:hypothetical protein